MRQFLPRPDSQQRIDGVVRRERASIWPRSRAAKTLRSDAAGSDTARRGGLCTRTMTDEPSGPRDVFSVGYQRAGESGPEGLRLSTDRVRSSPPLDELRRTTSTPKDLRRRQSRGWHGLRAVRHVVDRIARWDEGRAECVECVRIADPSRSTHGPDDTMAQYTAGVVGGVNSVHEIPNFFSSSG